MFEIRKSYIIIFLLLWCSNPVKSEERGGVVSWVSSNDTAIHVVSMITGEHLAYFKNHIDTLPRFILTYEDANGLVGRRGNIFSRSGLWLVTFSGSGRVFEIDTLNNTIDRQDRTFYQGYNFGAYQFQRNDTIFSFGGYGFWITNNLLTYYSDVRQEWDFMSHAPFPNEVPERVEQPRNYCFYDSNHDVLFSIQKNILYAFDFRNHRWSKKGTLTKEINFNDTYNQHKLTDSTLLIMGRTGAWEIYFYGNTVTNRSLDNGLNYLTISHGDQFDCMYRLNDQTVLMPKVSDVIAVGYSIEFLKTAMLDKGQVPLFSSTSGRNWRLVFLTLALMVILFLVFIFRDRLPGKNSKIKALNRYFNLTQADVLQQLLSGPLLADDLNSILNVQEKSWEVQRRQRSIFLKELNVLGLRIFQVEIVLREKSPTDKRQVVYVINPQIQDQLAQLLP